VVQIPSTAGNDQVKNIPEHFLSGQRIYGTHERGLVLVLPGQDLPPVRFSDNAGKTHLAFFDFDNDKGGRSPEIQRRQAMALERTKTFLQGRVYYVPSAEEVAAKEKKERQKASLERYRELLSAGVFEIVLIDKNMDQLVLLAEEIGAPYLDKNGKRTQKHVITKNIRELLGLKEEEKVEEVFRAKPKNFKKEK
jgi:hypothetical protein